jgi:hypothetical protein
MIFVASMKLPRPAVHEQEWNGAWHAALLMDKVDIQRLEAIDSDLSGKLWKRIELPFFCAPVQLRLPVLLNTLDVR